MLLAVTEPNTAGPSRRERTVTFALVAILHVLLFFLLLYFAPPLALQRLPTGVLKVFNLPNATVDTTRSSHAATRRSQKSAQAQPQKRPRVEPVHRPVPSETMTAARANEIWSRVIPMTHQQMASVDRTMHTRKEEQQQSADASDSSAGAAALTDDSDGPGTGPHGETLYNARWYREPTHAELDTYMPPDRPSGVGIIGCKTVPVPRWHVEDCFDIAQSPAGSGLAEAVRRAAWQFLVMPPRVGGHYKVGEWVRIRITYTITHSKPGEREAAE